MGISLQFIGNLQTLRLQLQHGSRIIDYIHGALTYNQGTKNIIN